MANVDGGHDEPDDQPGEAIGDDRARPAGAPRPGATSSAGASVRWRYSAPRADDAEQQQHARRWCCRRPARCACRRSSSGRPRGSSATRSRASGAPRRRRSPSAVRVVRSLISSPRISRVTPASPRPRRWSARKKTSSSEAASHGELVQRGADREREVADLVGRAALDDEQARRRAAPRRRRARAPRRARRRAASARGRRVAVMRLAIGPLSTSRPRWMTRTSSTVCSTSESTWLETSTVRPSAAAPRRKSRSQRMPCGSRPLAGSSSTRTSGSPSSVAARPEPLAHAGRVAAGAPVGRAAHLHEVEHLVDARRGQAGERRERAQVVAARAARVHARRSRGWRRPSGPGSAAPRTGGRGSSPCPAVGRARPSTMRSVVVLPAPLGPRKPVTAPARTAKERSSTAVTAP